MKSSAQQSRMPGKTCSIGKCSVPGHGSECVVRAEAHNPLGREAEKRRWKREADYEKREQVNLNYAQSALDKSTSERDTALREIESLKSQIAARKNRA